jgi:hypothetical protein
MWKEHVLRSRPNGAASVRDHADVEPESGHMAMATLPRGWPCSSYPIASGASINGYVLSITGLTWPDAMSSASRWRSSRRSVVASPRSL